MQIRRVMTREPGNNLAPYAVADEAGQRIHAEPDDPLRTPFELDCHRVIECTAFRRLENKTQVFAPSHHDHFRTRLTHTLEVARIARTLARALRANESLTEAITLAHDLGHPPFGHAGEAALDEMMVGNGGFNHNLHAVRVVEYLEHPFPAFRGLNLTLESLAGMRTHATTYDVADAPKPTGPTGASVEGQIASIADRIAYNCHDLEDAIGAGFVELDDLYETPLWRAAHSETASADKTMTVHAVRRLVLDNLLNRVLCDIVHVSRSRLEQVESPNEAKELAEPAVAMSPQMADRLACLEEFLLRRVYHHSDIAAMDRAGRDMVVGLFAALQANRAALPERFRTRVDEQGPARVICDYIAGMTDRFCRAECRRLNVDVPSH